MAQVLRDDEVGRETAQRFGVDRINTFTASAEFTNKAVNFGRRGVFGDARMDHDFFRASGWGKVALVADANDLLIEP